MHHVRGRGRVTIGVVERGRVGVGHQKSWFRHCDLYSRTSNGGCGARKVNQLQVEQTRAPWRCGTDQCGRSDFEGMGGLKFQVGSITGGVCRPRIVV